MIRPCLTFRSLPTLLLTGCLLFQGCASIKNTGPSIKTGMHIDAVLECAIEYPLLWTKDRRLAYGSKNGEILWTPPQADGTLLRLISQQHKTIDPEQQISELLHALTDPEVSLREEVSLPAGVAVHIIAGSTEKHIEIYQIAGNTRNYLLSLTMLKKHREGYSEIMDIVIHSFRILQ